MKPWIASVALIALATGLTACSSSTSEETVYAGPGSKWSATIRADGTFNLTETTADPDLVIDGTYTTLDSGFLKMTVATATGPADGTPTAGSQVYAMNIPGVMLIVKPIGEGSQIIPMVAGGACPTADTTLNWIQMAASDDLFDISDKDLAGSFTVTAASSTASLPTKWAVDGTALGSFDLGTFSCSAGVASLSLSTDATMYLTASTGAIVHTEHDDGNDIIFATEQKTLSGFSALAGDYYGLVFSGEVLPVKMTKTTAGVMTVESIDVETSATTANIPATNLNPVTAVNSPGNGMIRYEFADFTTEKVICIASDDLFSSGKSVLFCAGDEPNTSGETGTEGKMFSAIFFKK